MKPKNCTCHYPRELSRTKSGHRADCPCHAEFLRQREANALLQPPCNKAVAGPGNLK